ncbi:MAG: Ldh family oxidoreductase [Planctomycetaceae bacterium]|nr:Ldh family oxidoreductase [Planctomycetaceae bacterium]
MSTTVGTIIRNLPPPMLQMTDSFPYPRDAAAETRVPVEVLRAFIVRVLIKKSMFQFDADVVADRMLEADLRGIDGHGCRALPDYVEVMDLGDIDPRARVLVEHETVAVATLDGSRAMGQVAATKAMDLAVKKAQEVGTGTVAVHHSQHLGAASVYALLAAKQGLIGFCTSNTGSPSVTAPGTKQPAVANAPLAWAIPTADGHPIVVDFATGAASWGKLKLLQTHGLPVPAGIALDETGTETTDPNLSKVLLPAAGARGFGLALTAALLSGGLAGGKLPHQKKRSAASECSEHLLMAIDMAHFSDRDRFLARAAEAQQAIRELTPVDPDQPVRTPGDRGARTEADRRTNGIPLHSSDLEALAALGRKLKIEAPWQPTS